MSLTPEQKQTVAQWIAAGDNLSAVQKKITEAFKLSMTYMDVRFLVDDLNLTLKDPAPKASPHDVTQNASPAPAADPHAPSTDAEFTDDTDLPPEAADATLANDLPTGGGNVTLTVDKVTLLPGAMASGTVTFSDGVSGKWIVDNYGRPGFSEISQPGYRPKPADAQAFMQELSLALQNRGL